MKQYNIKNNAIITVIGVYWALADHNIIKSLFFKKKKKPSILYWTKGYNLLDCRIGTY